MNQKIENRIINKIEKERKRKEESEVKELEIITKDINSALEKSVKINNPEDIERLDKELSAFKTNKIFDLIRKHNIFSLGNKKEKIFKIIQKKDRKDFKIRKLTSFKNEKLIGITHYSKQRIRYFVVGIVLYDNIVFYEIDNIPFVKYILSTTTDRYKDGTISNSVIFMEELPYSVNNEINFPIDREIILNYSAHVIQTVIDDSLIKDLLSYTKNNYKFFGITFVMGIILGLFLGFIGGLLISAII